MRKMLLWLGVSEQRVAGREGSWFKSRAVHPGELTPPPLCLPDSVPLPALAPACRWHRGAQTCSHHQPGDAGISHSLKGRKAHPWTGFLAKS